MPRGVGTGGWGGGMGGFGIDRYIQSSFVEGFECKHGRSEKEIEEEDENPGYTSNFRQENYL